MHQMYVPQFYMAGWGWGVREGGGKSYRACELSGVGGGGGQMLQFNASELSGVGGEQTCFLFRFWRKMYDILFFLRLYGGLVEITIFYWENLRFFFLEGGSFFVLTPLG